MKVNFLGGWNSRWKGFEVDVSMKNFKNWEVNINEIKIVVDILIFNIKRAVGVMGRFLSKSIVSVFWFIFKRYFFLLLEEEWILGEKELK